MKTEIQIRPEQAQYLLQLFEQAAAAQAAIKNASQGIFAGEAVKGKIVDIKPDGTVTIETDEDP